jgi:hypothetical protein
MTAKPIQTNTLTLRSGPQDRVSKGGLRSWCSPSFETPRFAWLLRMRFFGFEDT